MPTGICPHVARDDARVSRVAAVIERYRHVIAKFSVHSDDECSHGVKPRRAAAADGLRPDDATRRDLAKTSAGPGGGHPFVVRWTS
jgi:hypothetical protein